MPEAVCQVETRRPRYKTKPEELKTTQTKKGHEIENSRIKELDGRLSNGTFKVTN